MGGLVLSSLCFGLVCSFVFSCLVVCGFFPHLNSKCGGEAYMEFMTM